jgi:hypothetical protein
MFVTCSFVHHALFHTVHRLIEQRRRPDGRLGKDTAANVEAAVATLQKEAEQLRATGEASFEVHYEPMGDGSFVASIVVRSSLRLCLLLNSYHVIVLLFLCDRLITARSY